MKVFELIEACCEVYDDLSLQPTDGRTFCNLAVNRIVSTVYGYTAFKGKMANEIIDVLGSGAPWQKIRMEDAQRIANEGFAVVAAQKAVPHGHVAIVRPGVAKTSSKWSSVSVPMLVNIGAKNSIARAANWVFPNGTPPDFYVLR